MRERTEAERKDIADSFSKAVAKDFGMGLGKAFLIALIIALFLWAVLGICMGVAKAQDSRCLDSDGDGVLDYLDQCPFDPTDQCCAPPEAGSGAAGEPAAGSGAGGAGGSGGGPVFGTPSNIMPIRELQSCGSGLCYNAHEYFGNEQLGNGHTHCEEGHRQGSGDACADQAQRLVDAGHTWLVMSAHSSTVKPDELVPGMAWIYGAEAYTYSSGDNVHVLYLCPPGVSTTTSISPGVDIQGAVDQAAALGCVLALAHPARHTPTVSELTDTSGLYGVSVAWERPASTGDASYLDTRLDSGSFACATNGLDFHGDSDLVTGGIGLMQTPSVLPDGLEAHEQFRACNYFSCKENGGTLPSDLTLDILSGVLMVTGVLDGVEWYSQDGLVGTDVFYNPDGTEIYMRAEISLGSAICFSQPVWRM